MDSVSLYKLPKDILVKLIITIQDDMKKDFAKTEKKIKIFQETCFYKLIECGHKDCDHIHIVHKFNVMDGYVYNDYGVESIVCDGKHLAFCDYHIDDEKIKRIRNIEEPQYIQYVCDICIENLVLEGWELDPTFNCKEKSPSKRE